MFANNSFEELLHVRTVSKIPLVNTESSRSDYNPPPLTPFFCTESVQERFTYTLDFKMHNFTTLMFQIHNLHVWGVDMSL